jgi:hypothetical protein
MGSDGFPNVMRDATLELDGRAVMIEGAVQ